MSFLLLLACGPKGPQGVHVRVEADQIDLTPEEDKMLAVLDAANPEVQDCYLDELKRDPRAYGDLVFVTTLSSDGTVQDVEISLSTVSSGIDACVIEVVKALEFPPPAKAGTTLRYPIVLTSEVTPKEITRALMQKHGLLDAEAEAAAAEEAALDPKAREEQGERGWTESW